MSSAMYTDSATIGVSKEGSVAATFSSSLPSTPGSVCLPTMSAEDDKKTNDESTGSLRDFYLCESSSGVQDGSGDSSRNSPASVGVVCEDVQRITSNIYNEFKAMIEAYGVPVVERLMPLVITLLKNLDELYKDRSAYQVEVDQLREQCSFMTGELDREKERRKQSELRLLQAEDAFEEEKKSSESKIEALTTTCRHAELRFQNVKDQGKLQSYSYIWHFEKLFLNVPAGQNLTIFVSCHDAPSTPLAGIVVLLFMCAQCVQSLFNLFMCNPSWRIGMIFPNELRSNDSVFDYSALRTRQNGLRIVLTFNIRSVVCRELSLDA
ncbi:hypothetical protein PHET_11465 [Paragonimus heterotremus]|uniref:RH1 domain-containing protein n=1 Tax=Paragonimus heterotremus TaxID=100268 RepID=A0A8J4T408_9TREM|nr:hypothetical protein PHET_11465 [Paragonimus heterotremus]